MTAFRTDLAQAYKKARRKYYCLKCDDLTEHRRVVVKRAVYIARRRDLHDGPSFASHQRKRNVWKCTKCGRVQK